MRMHTAAPGAHRPGHLSSVIALALAIGTSTWPAQAAPLRISGLRADEPLQARVQPQLDGQRMLLPLGESGALRIQPWPAGLPSQLGPQQLSAQWRRLPAGPVARLDFTRTGEDQAWLVLGSGTRPGHKLLGGWRLQMMEAQWWARRGDTRILLDGASPQPAALQVDGATWCMSLLDGRIPESPHIAALREQEAQADWAMVRLEGDRRGCDDMDQEIPAPLQQR